MNLPDQLRHIFLIVENRGEEQVHSKAIPLLRSLLQSYSQAEIDDQFEAMYGKPVITHLDDVTEEDYLKEAAIYLLERMAERPDIE